MLTLRSEQLAALQRVPRQAFVRHLLEHCRKHFAGDFALLGPGGTRRVVELGLLRAEAHGFTGRLEVSFYVSLMFLLNSYFDEDPLLPWAAETLADPGIPSPAVRIERLWDRAVRHLDRIAGPGGMLANRALAKLQRAPFEDLIGPGSGDLEADVRAALAGLHPVWLNDLPASAVAGLVKAARESAVEHGLENREGIILSAGLMFLLGVSVARDPLYPWVREALAAPPFDEPAVKARQVFTTARIQLRRYLARS